MIELLIAGFACLAGAIVWDLVVPIRVGPARMGGPLLAAAGSALFVVLGARAMTGRQMTADLHRLLALPVGGLRVDHLAGLFLVICFGVAVPVLLAVAEWARRGLRRHGIGGGIALLLAAAALVIAADDVFVLVGGWELLSLAFYLLAGAPQRSGGGRAAMTAFSFGKIGGGLLLVGFLLLAAPQRGPAGWRFADLAVHLGPRHDIAYALLVAGFASKVGLLPFHVWVPPTYAAAAGPVRALLAGAAVNVGFYGLYRTAALLGRPPVWLVVAVLVVAGITAILGIAHAAVQTHLMRVIAYSSVENAGLILAGYGVALAGWYVGQPRLVAVGLLAATLQVIAHAAAKALLFVSAAAPERHVGSDDLDELVGIGRRLPASGAGLAIGSITLAGLPLTAGFVSEWFLLEALMQQFRLTGLAVKVAMAVAGALVALTTGFAGVTFVRLFGFVVLGKRNGQAATNRERGDLGWLGGSAVAILSLVCLATAAIAPEVIRFIAAGLDPLVGRNPVTQALNGPWVLQPVFADFSILSPSWLWIVLPGFLALAAGIGLTGSRLAMLRVRRVPAWRSATGGVAGHDRYTAFGYTNPTRKLLAGLLLTRTELRALEAATGGRAGSGQRGVGDVQLGYTSDVVEAVGAFLYRPLIRWTRRVVAGVKRLQSGRLEAYLAYMLAALIALLAAVAGMGHR